MSWDMEKAWALRPVENEQSHNKICVKSLRGRIWAPGRGLVTLVCQCPHCNEKVKERKEAVLLLRPDDGLLGFGLQRCRGEQPGPLMNESDAPSQHSAASLSARSDFIDHAEAADQYLISRAGLPGGACQLELCVPAK